MIEHTSSIKFTLPRSSYVAHEVHRVAGASLIWSCKKSLAANEWQEYSYASEIEGEEQSFYEERKFAYHERYGGEGLVGNAGGVRVGLLGRYSVKGLGCSILANPKASFWHRYGGAHLREGIREVIWGEAANAALPYGAARTVALIDTKKVIALQYKTFSGRSTSKRVLAVRENLIRPAHFMRGSELYGETDRRHVASDTQRTLEVWKSLGLILSSALHLKGDTSARELIEQSIRRIGTQVGVARGKRLIHGSLSPSNIGVDGRLVDFGMSSSAPDHGRIIVAGRMPDAWNQDRSLHFAIDDLAYYAIKYGKIQEKHSTLSLEWREILKDNINHSFRRELLNITAVPKFILDNLDAHWSGRISRAIEAIIQEGSFPFKLLCPCDSYKPFMPEKFGRFNVGKLVLDYWIAACDNPEACNVGENCFSHSLYGEFGAVMDHLRQASIRDSTNYEETLSKLTYMLINAARRGAPLEKLQYHTMNKEIDRAIDEELDLSEYINESIMINNKLLTDPLEDKFEILTNFGNGIMDWSRGMMIGDRLFTPGSATLQALTSHYLKQ